MSSTGGADGEESTPTPDDLPGADDADGAPTRDDLFEALDNRRRRYTLHYLQRHEGEEPVDVSEISTQVAAWELDAAPEQIGYSDRKNVHTALYQFHAPKLDSLGLIDYDERCGTAELTEPGERLWVDIGWDERDDEVRAPQVGAVLGVSSVGLIAVAAQLSLPDLGALAVPLAAALLVGFWVGTRWTTDDSDPDGVVAEHPPPPVEK